MTLAYDDLYTAFVNNGWRLVAVFNNTGKHARYIEAGTLRIGTLSVDQLRTMRPARDARPVKTARNMLSRLSTMRRAGQMSATSAQRIRDLCGSIRAGEA